MLLSLLFTMLCTNVNDMSPARSVAGLLISVLGVNSRFLQVVSGCLRNAFFGHPGFASHWSVHPTLYGKPGVDMRATKVESSIWVLMVQLVEHCTTQRTRIPLNPENLFSGYFALA